MVIFSSPASCLAPTDMSLRSPKTAYSSISLCLIGNIIHKERTFVNPLATFFHRQDKKRPGRLFRPGHRITQS